MRHKLSKGKYLKLFAELGYIKSGLICKKGGLVCKSPLNDFLACSLCGSSGYWKPKYHSEAKS